MLAVTAGRGAESCRVPRVPWQCCCHSGEAELAPTGCRGCFQAIPSIIFQMMMKVRAAGPHMLCLVWLSSLPQAGFDFH